MEVAMLTDCLVVLTLYDPLEKRVTNFTNIDEMKDKLDLNNLIEERFVLEDVSH